MKIRTKLLLALSTLPILLILLVVIGRTQVSNFNNISDTLEKNYELTTLAETIHRDMKDESIALRNLLLYQSETTIQTEIENIRSISIRISENINALETHATTSEQRRLIEQLTSANKQFNDYKNEVILLVNNGDTQQAISLMDTESADLHNQFFELIPEVTTAFESDMVSSIQTAKADFNRYVMMESIILGIVIIFIMSILFRSVWMLTSRLNKVSKIMSRIANGKTELNTKVEVLANDEIDEVAQSFNQMTASVEEKREKEKDLIWTKTHLAQVTTNLSGQKSVESLSQTFLSQVVPLVRGSHAVFYVKEEMSEIKDPIFQLRASYAFKERKHMTNEFHLGEGIIGQAVLEKTPIILSNVPSDYIAVKSGLGEAPPLNLYVLPILFEGEVKAVLEIGSFETFSEKEQDFLEELIDDFGIILDSITGRIKLAKALEESQTLMEEIQAQSEELQTQQDELKTTNEELEQQTEALKRSEEKLQLQQEELEQANVELEEKANSLEEQNRKFEQKNYELETARAELEERAKQLALSSKYKSEFLANMSHELRTPLNSMLILSKLLADNMDGTLSDKQVEYAKTIHSSGKDLLTLINDILDLSKIESGKMDVHPSKVLLKDLTTFVESNFKPVADNKNLRFRIEVNQDTPESLYTDETKIQQVLKNLLGNAFKFTKTGHVSLYIDYDHSKSLFVFTVQDTGIGISKDKQQLIFEAFQQADGTTSRKFGGTGLGLSISKEIATLLGGTIHVESKEGEGSTFTFSIESFDEKKTNSTIQEVAAATEHTASNPDSEKEEMEPKSNSESTSEIDDNNHIKRLLIVDDDLNQRNSLMELIGDMNVIMKAVSSGVEALEELKRSPFDCIILDLGLTDTTGFQLLEEIMEKNIASNLKVFVYTGRDLTSKEELYLNKYAQTIIIKDEHSPHRLKEELELYLNQNLQYTSPLGLPKSVIHNSEDAELKGKRILLVDDDIRNVYALSSILEHYGMEIIFAENGLEGLGILQNNPEIDLVLMDIMMPEMDGYEATRRIREMPDFSNLPIIALTAKAMKDDRKKCLEAGASDYIVKPVDTDQLISLIKVWLFN
ncbi:response regulator [Oceanobacillus halophilus]|uniref:Circadian input-output histidine kinase CikA n=1 Tax=Oceanobacillus halophilus TaxID=930130 RepID=A0A495A889_9BACI|nr:response regulator [Oceanobacillus halophilus]RKQ35621.1 response regulator [Oceanobacillus halophilus]